MRLFVALPLKEEARLLLGRAVAALQEENPNARAVSPENLHVTLAFLGEQPTVKPIIRALEQVAFAPFSMQAARLGCVKRVLWLSITPSPELTDLHKQVTDRLREERVPFDAKKFRAHITLFRDWDTLVPQTPRELQTRQGMLVDRVAMMQTQFVPGGVTYQEQYVREATV